MAGRRSSSAASATLSPGLRPSATWTLVPVGLAILILAAAGLGAGLAALNALFRDVRHLVPFALQLALYASPVVYPASLVPERYRAAYFLNPVAGALEAFRGGVAGSPPDPALLAISGASALALLIAGVALFLRVESGAWRTWCEAMTLAVRAEGLAKRYRLGGHRTGRLLYEEIGARLRRRSAPPGDRPDGWIWALSDVSLRGRRGRGRGRRRPQRRR